MLPIFWDRVGIPLELLEVVGKWHSKQFQHGVKHAIFFFFANLLDEILSTIVLMVISLSPNEVERFSICSLMSCFFIVKYPLMFWYSVYV